MLSAKGETSQKPPVARSFPCGSGHVANGLPSGWPLASGDARVLATVDKLVTANDQSFLTQSDNACHGVRFQWPRACPDGDGKTNSCVLAMVWVWMP